MVWVAQGPLHVCSQVVAAGLGGGAHASGAGHSSILPLLSNPPEHIGGEDLIAHRFSWIKSSFGSDIDLAGIEFSFMRRFSPKSFHMCVNICVILCPVPRADKCAQDKFVAGDGPDVSHGVNASSKPQYPSCGS